MASGNAIFNDNNIPLLDFSSPRKNKDGVIGAVVKENGKDPLKVLKSVPVYSSDEDEEGIRKLLTKQEVKKLGLTHLYEMYNIFGNGLDKRQSVKAEFLIKSIVGTGQVNNMELYIRCQDFIEDKGISAIGGSNNDKIMQYLQQLKYDLVNAPKRPMVVLGQGVAVQNQIAIPQKIAPTPQVTVFYKMLDETTEKSKAMWAECKNDCVDFTNDDPVVEYKLSPKRLAEVGVIGQPVPAKTSNMMVYNEEDIKKNIKYTVETVIDAPVKVPDYSSFVLKRYNDNNVLKIRMQFRKEAKIKEYINIYPYVKTQAETIRDCFLSDLTILRESIDNASKLFLYVESIKTLLVSKNNANGGKASLTSESNLSAYGSLDVMTDTLDKLIVQQLHIDEHVAEYPDELNVLTPYYCPLKTSFRHFVYMLVNVVKPLTLHVHSQQQDSICKWVDGVSDKLNQLMMSNFCKSRELNEKPVYGFVRIGGAWFPVDEPIRPNNGNKSKSKFFYYALPCMCSYKQEGPYDTHKMHF